MKRILTLLLVLASLSAFAEDLVLENNHAKLVFDGDSKEFCIKNFFMEGMDIAASRTTPPWEIELLGPRGELALIKPGMAIYDGCKIKNDNAHFTWRLLLDGQTENYVLMTVSLAPEMELPVFAFSVIVPEGWTVTAAEYPRIAVRRPEGAKVIMPVGYGVRYDAPAAGWLRAEYPSCTGGLQMTMAESPEGTVFFSTRDDDASQKVLWIGCEGDALIFLQKTIANYDWTEHIGNHGIFQIPWNAVLGFTREGWEKTALKWYRPWALTAKWGRMSLAERAIPGWMRQTDIWLSPEGATQETMDGVRRALKYFGKGVGLHWYQWHHNDFDTNYPDYFPAKDGFREMVAEAQELGANVTPYINGRLWDTGNRTYAELGGAEASCRRRDGTLYTEIYGSKVLNTVTCPSSPIWRNIIFDLNRQILDSLGAHGVYIDQIAAAKGEPCYAEGHPHSPGGGEWWHLAYRKMLQQMRSEIYTPEQAMTTEENAECYIDLFDMMLVVNSPHGPGIEMVPLFPLIYSDRCIYSGFTYTPHVLNDGSFDFMTMKSLLWGAQLGWVGPVAIMKEENAAQAEFLRTLGEFRRGSHDLFEGGRFLGEFAPGGDNPETDIPGYQRTHLVMGAEWAPVKGRNAYILVNMDVKEHKVTLPSGRSVSVPARSALRVRK